MSASIQVQEAILFRALASPAHERAAFLARCCAGDPCLRHVLTELLDAATRAGDFLEAPPLALAPELARPARDDADRRGDRIGHYQLIERLGEGGAGVVYEAEQLQPVRRRVALKVMKSGADPAASMRRFALERQALAWMEHPNIAQVFDAGTTDDGRLFFVMELVRGMCLTAYCDENRLRLHERLALLVPVCLAAHHAHEKGIVHRDLKPANILVAVHDGQPMPKIIDFGIAAARPVAGQGREAAETTTPGDECIGTPEYLSPEQAEEGHGAVDPRSDVYSLGVILFELLTGTTPRRLPRDASCSDLRALRRLIRHEHPPCPSTWLAALASERLRSRAAQRQTPPEALVPAVRGALDAITLRCLARQPDLRYPTAAAVAHDLQRYLHEACGGEHLTGGPPTRPSRDAARATGAAATSAPTTNQAAFAAYLQGRRLADRSFNRTDLEGAVAAFEEATRRDPEFALAWAHLSMAHGAMYWFTFLDPSTDRLVRCKAAVDEALRLQPDLPQAHLTLGVYYYRGFRDWQNAQRELEAASLCLPDDPAVWCYLGLNTRRLGRWTESTAHFERTVALDPRHAAAWGGLADNHAFHRRHGQALEACDHALAIAPDDRRVRRARCWSRFALEGHRPALVAGLAACFADPPDDARDRVELALLQGNYAGAARVLAASPVVSYRDHRRELAKAELQAIVEHLRGDHARAREFAAIASGFYGASMLHRESEEAFTLLSLGRMLALQDRREEAIAYGHAAMARLPVPRDALWGTEVIGEHAALCLLAGATEEALTHLEILLRGPCDLSALELRVHPLWRRLCGDPRFEALLASAGPLPAAA